MLMLFEQILNGLLVGSYYTLLALGLSIIFSLGGVVNLAHGAFYAVGAYLTVLFTDILGFGLAWGLEGACQNGFLREWLLRKLVLDLHHELLPGPGGFTAIAIGFLVVVVAEPHSCCELRDRSDEPEIAGSL